MPDDAGSPDTLHGSRPGGRQLRRGLRGSLDLPVGAVDNPARVEVGGWVFHRHGEVLTVVVLVDARVVGTARCTTARPDVAAAHAGAPVRSGWSTVVDLGRVGAQATITVHALVAAPAGDEPSRHLELLPFGERTVEVAGGGVVRGEVVLPDEVSSTTLRVTGTADVAPSLARVEVTVGDRAPVRARHSLPSESLGDALGEERMRGFAATVKAPRSEAELTVRVTVVATDGTRADLPTARVPVTAPDEGNARRRVQDQRLAQHLDAIRAAFPAGSRVLVAAHDLGVGGAQNYLDDLMRGLHERGVPMCVVAGSDGPLLDRIESTYGAPVLVVGPAPETAELLDARMRLIAGFAVEHGAAACLANTLVSFPAVLVASHLGLPTLWAIHESFTPAVFWHEYLGRPAEPAVVDATNDALRQATEVAFVAESTRQLYADAVPDSASALVPYGLDIAATDALLARTPRDRARAELGIPLDRRVLLCVGSVEARKGQLALVRAFGRLGQAAGHASLYIVGATPTPYTRVLRELVHDNGLDDVHVVDSDPDVMRWYAAADVLVSAADVESMPRTMLEAMLAGRPVAGVSVFGVPELVEDGVTGWLCEPNDLGALTDLMRRAVTAGAAQLSSMGAAARARVERDFSSAGFVEHVSARLQGWLADAAGPTTGP